MITIIAGSRGLGRNALEAALERYKCPITAVACGCAPGIDKCGYDYARDNDLPVIFFPAWAYHYSWAMKVKKAGELIIYPRGGYRGNTITYGNQRNKTMVEYESPTGNTEALLAIWDGQSKGALDTAYRAEHAGLIVTKFEVRV